MSNFVRRLSIVTAALAVAGTVAVAVAPRAAHAVAAVLVTVNNTSASPVPVREANSPDVYPFVLQFCTNTQVGSECTAAGANNGSSAAVPTTTPDGVAVLFADLDNFSAFCSSLGANIADQVVTVDTTFQGVFGFDEWAFPVLHINGFAAIANHRTRIYADPGTSVFISLNGSEPQAQACAVTLSGHLVTR